MGRTGLLGFDVGGGGARCLWLDLESGETHAASRAWSHPVTPGSGGVAFDLDLPGLWAALCDASAELLARAGAGPECVAGIASTGMRFTTVVLDGAGRPLLATPNRDARAAAEGYALATAHGPLLHRTSGHWPLPIQTAARLCWLRDHAPERFARAAVVLSLPDWLNHRLCGVLATDPSQASGTLLYDLAARDWSRHWLERLGLPAALLPPLAEPGTLLGPLGREAAAALGLRAGTPVAQGGADTQCGLLGAGVVGLGQTGAVTGSSAPVQRVLERPSVDPDGRLWTEPHVLAGCWVLESNAGPMGEAIAWLGRLLYPNAPEAERRLLAEAADSEPGASGMLSTLGAEVMDGRDLTLPVGDLTLSHLASPDHAAGRRHLARSVLEGMAYALRANLEQLSTLAGEPLGALRLAGGLAASPVWAQLVCDVVGRPVLVSRAGETSALGAALCAGAGAGLLTDLAEAAQRRTEVAALYAPESADAEVYRAGYAAWQALRGARERAQQLAVAHNLPAVLRSGAASAAARPERRLRPRILVTAEADEDALRRLRALGEVQHESFRRSLRLLGGRALVEALRGVEVFVTEVDVVDAASLLALPELRVIAACRGDAVNVDVEAAAALGIPVLHAPGRNAEAVAELTLALLLALARHLPAACGFLRDPAVEAGDRGRMGQAFEAFRGSELAGKTVGLVGLGAVGRAVARRLRGFGVRLLVHDPHVSEASAVRAGAHPVSLDALLAGSHFVSLHAAAGGAARPLLAAPELSRMRRGAYLVNTARAALVDEHALAEALRSGQLAGAALDVFAVEPPGADHPLLQLENVIATPHVGGNTAEVAGHQGRIVAVDLDRLLRGERPRHVLDPAALDGFDWSGPRRLPPPALLAGLAARPAPSVTDLERESAARGGATAGGESAARGGATAGGESAARGGATAGGESAARGGAAAGGESATRVGASAPAARRAAPAAPPPASLRHMERLLADFLERASRDAALRACAAGRDVTLLFTLRDLGLGFHLRLRDGALAAGLGPPSTPADAELGMRAELFDAIFTGRASAAQAALGGRLSFRGDTVKAMTLQELEPDLCRLYGEARAALGAPEALDLLPDPADPRTGADPAQRAGANAAPRAGADPDPGVAAAPADAGLREEIVRVVQELYGQRLLTATGGNVSARAAGADELWITPGQLFKGGLGPAQLVRTDLEGRPLDPNAQAPSSEVRMHCAAYRARPDATAVIHAHAPHATILANTGLPFLPISTEAAFFGELPRIPFVMPGSEELAQRLEAALRESWAVLLVNHGLLVAGRSLRRAADMAEVIDRSAQVILGCHAVGREPPSLPAEIVARLRALGDMLA